MPSGDAVPVAAGGTGAVNAAAARANLSALNALLPSLRNRLINGAMLINQRSFAGGSLAAGVYGYDRWKAGSGGASFSVSSAGVITHTNGPLIQVIEDNGAADLAGTSVTVSVEDPSGSVSVSLAYSATNTTTVTGSIASGSGRQGVTLTLPSGTGTLTLTLTGSGVTYKRVQLEPGSTATSWDARPYGIEFFLCQRYFQIFGGVYPYQTIGLGNFPNTVLCDVMVHMPVQMRTSPVLTANNPGSFTITDGISAYTPTAITGPDASSTNAFLVRASISGATTGRAARMYTNNSTAAYITLSAEL
ncbi:hypothetical protein [uncultured Pseudomonas sp.]|uniref:hypothetical protein n=1 Tax=uncultured Pseudomonas sp. TaxID=114707 RepID=UPI00258E7CCA|nr:hypothetical protein [uncultured Pseudomonas sp.]